MPPLSPRRPLSEIHYLRWARAEASRARVALTHSGMPAPDASWLDGIAGAALLAHDSRDFPPLADQIAESWNLQPGSVLLQPGTHWMLLLLLAARLDRQPGPVIVEDPTYEPLVRIPEALGAPVLRVPRPRAARFALDLDALAALAPQRPSVLIVSQPHNPSGAVLDADTVAQLARWSAQTGCAVLSDEVYLEFLEAPEEQTLLSRVEGCANVRSFTKVMGLGALRITAAAGPRNWIARAAALSDYGAVMVPAPCLALGACVWPQRERLWQRARAAARAGTEQVVAWARALDGQVELCAPQAGIVCFPRLPRAVHERLVSRARAAGVRGPFGYGLDDQAGGSHEWIAWLHQQSGVLVTPGTFFDDVRAFRVGFGGAPEALREGLSALASFITGARVPDR